MNRQQRRKLERERIKNFDVKKLKNFEKEPPEFIKIRERKLMHSAILIVEEALRLEFGMGNKRLGYFYARFQEVSDKINSDELDINDLAEKSYISKLIAEEFKN